MHWKSCFFSTPHQNNKFCITTKDAFCYAVVKSVCSVPAKLVTESWSFWHIIYFKFSNSLIIHQVKTKEITTMKEVWIPVLISIEFDDFTSPFTPWVLFRLRRYVKHSRQCFIGYSPGAYVQNLGPVGILWRKQATGLDVFRGP